MYYNDNYNIPIKYFKVKIVIIPNYCRSNYEISLLKCEKV